MINTGAPGRITYSAYCCAVLRVVLDRCVGNARSTWWQASGVVVPRRLAITSHTVHTRADLALTRQCCADGRRPVAGSDSGTVGTSLCSTMRCRSSGSAGRLGLCVRAASLRSTRVLATCGMRAAQEGLSVNLSGYPQGDRRRGGGQTADRACRPRGRRRQPTAGAEGNASCETRGPQGKDSDQRATSRAVAVRWSRPRTPVTGHRARCAFACTDVEQGRFARVVQPSGKERTGDEADERLLRLSKPCSTAAPCAHHSSPAHHPVVRMCLKYDITAHIVSQSLWVPPCLVSDALSL